MTIPRKLRQRTDAAKNVEDRLRAEGRHFEADQIRNLRNTAIGSYQTNARLAAEIEELRKKGTAEIEHRGIIT